MSEIPKPDPDSVKLASVLANKELVKKHTGEYVVIGGGKVLGYAKDIPGVTKLAKTFNASALYYRLGVEEVDVDPPILGLPD